MGRFTLRRFEVIVHVGAPPDTVKACASPNIRMLVSDALLLPPKILIGNSQFWEENSSYGTVAQEQNPLMPDVRWLLRQETCVWAAHSSYITARDSTIKKQTRHARRSRVAQTNKDRRPISRGEASQQLRLPQETTVRLSRDMISKLHMHIAAHARRVVRVDSSVAFLMQRLPNDEVP